MNYLEKAAVSRRIKARILGQSTFAKSKPEHRDVPRAAMKPEPEQTAQTPAFSIFHQVLTRLVPAQIAAPSIKNKDAA